MEKNFNENIIADLHVHLWDIPNEQSFYETLDMAEQNGVKSLTLLEYNNLNFFKYGLWDKVKNHISEHYSGKIVTGIEFVSTIDDGVVSKTGFDYSGYRSDLVVYNFNPNDLMPLFEDKFLQKLWVEDCKKFIGKINEFGFFPPNEIFINDGHPASYAKQLLGYLDANLEEKERFMKTFKLQKLDIESDITRNLITNPKGALFFHQKLFPNSSDVFKIAKKINGTVCLAHPAYMSTAFDTADYIKTMVALSKDEKDMQNITCMSGPYMLDRKEDTKVVTELSKELKISLIPTSDCKTNYRRIVGDKNEPVMYVDTMINGEKKRVFYKPRPGFAVCPWIESYLENHNGKVDDFVDFQNQLDTASANLFIEKSIDKQFSDIRELMPLENQKGE